ncbi:hypothetical protein NIES4074_01580 [Cylindrospermum sp. NIES-4074]|nr:hypothetical protein NIES4074_01580 [Cylindrospermum sp. NIES-4074]
MINRTAFYGSIYSGDYQVVANLLKNWVQSEDLNIKIRLSGEEILYEDERLYLYCYNAMDNEGVASSFLLEGNMSGTLDETKVFLQQLRQLCKDQYIIGSFEYVEVTEDGVEVSDQFYIE